VETKASGMVRRRSAAVARAMGWWLGVLLAALPLHLDAAPLLELMGGPGDPHPFTEGSWPDQLGAAYGNPALLVDGDGAFRLGAALLWQGLDIDYAARPPGADVSAAIYDARRVVGQGTERLTFRPLPTDELRAARGSASPGDLGGYLALAGGATFWDGRLAFGMLGLFPLGDFQVQAPYFVDEREQYFSNSLHVERFGDRMQNATFVFGAAWRALDWLALGVGATLLNPSESQVAVWVPDAGDQSVTEIQAQIRVKTSLAPHLGVVVTPLEGLRIGVTAHAPSSAGLEGRNTLQLFHYPYPEGEDAIPQDFDNCYLFEPWRVGLDAAWSREGPWLGWGVAARLRWSQWSAYRDRMGDAPSARWADTFTPALGGELRWRGHRWALDLEWEPSPVPEQRGRQSYVDNHRLGSALGWTWTLDAGGRTLTLALALQVHRLVARWHTKDLDADDPVFDSFPDSVDIYSDAPIAESAGLQTNNPGYPGFGSAGWLIVAGASAGIRF